MPIFTAIAAGVAAIAGAIGIGAAAASAIGAVGAFAARTLLTIGISKLISNTTDTPAAGSNTPAADPRAQKSPTTVNKIPVVYGSAYVGPTIIDAILSTDQTTMYYVCALSEVTTGTFTFGNIYFNGDLITLGTGGDAAKVLSLTNNAVPPQVDTKIAGNMYVYLFNNGSSSGINTGGQTAIQILSDVSIPVASRWSATDTMSSCAFAVIKLIYNSDAGTTQLGSLNFQLINDLDNPGAVISNYLTNTVYGCAIPVANIDTASLASLYIYSNELITYVPTGGGTATQARYRINGPINTGQNCLANLQDLCDACDSWLQYSELTGQWKVVINQSYEDYTTFNALYLIDSSNLIGGIDINPIDLNNTYNSLEVGYPNVNIKDQTDYRVFNLIDYVPEVMSPNEAANQLTVNYPQVNNYIQAAYLGERRLLQSREDLIITCALDYSGIQIEAGDVVRVTLAEYGWSEKLFRVSQVQEVKDESGFLGARISAFEYNNTIYANDPLNDFIPEANTGLINPKWLDNPGTPVITTSPLPNGTVASFSVTSTTPAVGSTMFMDFNYGLTSNVDTHKSYTTITTSDGSPFAVSTSVSVNVVNLPPETYYWSTTARTTTTGYKSAASAPYTWGGPNVTTYDPTSNTGGIGYTNINPTASPEERMSLVAFGIPDVGANTVTMPVQANSNVILNDPIYLDGTALNANYYYPYYQNTSTTANGYLATSTSSFQPARASYQVLNNGDDNWYVFVYDNFGSSSNYPLDPTEYFKLELNATFIANTDSVMQLGAFYSGSTTGTVIFHDTTIDGTYILPANVPTEINFVQAYGNSANNVTDGGGFIMKNIIGNTRVITLYTKLELFKGRIV